MSRPRKERPLPQYSPPQFSPTRRGPPRRGAVPRFTQAEDSWRIRECTSYAFAIAIIVEHAAATHRVDQADPPPGPDTWTHLLADPKAVPMRPKPPLRSAGDLTSRTPHGETLPGDSNLSPPSLPVVAHASRSSMPDPQRTTSRPGAPHSSGLSPQSGTPSTRCLPTTAATRRHHHPRRPSAVRSSGSSFSARGVAGARRTSSCADSVSHGSCVAAHGRGPFNAQASPASDEPAPERHLRRLPKCRRPPFVSPRSPVLRPCR